VGRSSEASASFEVGLAALAAARAPYDRASAHYAYAQHLKDGPTEAPRARDLLNEGSEIFRQLGAVAPNRTLPRARRATASAWSATSAD
jgi:hypothetical protein